MALFSLQKLFWLCLTPAPSGSYPSSVLLSSTKINSYSTLATNHKVDIQYFLIIESSWSWIFSPFGMDDLVFSSWHFSEWFYILLAMLPFDLPSYLWFFDTFLLSLCPVVLLSSFVGERLWLGSPGQHSSGSAWFLSMLVDILLCTYRLSLCDCPLPRTSFTWAKLDKERFICICLIPFFFSSERAV